MLRKYATLEILSSTYAQAGGPLVRTAHRAVFEYDPRPGFLYVRSRAISSRTNDNYDTFPAEEIEKGWQSFVGKPVFVNHHNEIHRRARGVIIDAVLHKDANHDGSPDTWVEVLMEVDAVNFPKLAQAIVAGHIERTSMGTDVEFSVCSFCNNKAATPAEYCKHIPRLKGQRIRRLTASGTPEDVLVSEVCYGLKFFENSLLVEDPADPTAYFLGVDTRGLAMAAANGGTHVLPGITRSAGTHPPRGTQWNRLPRSLQPSGGSMRRARDTGQGGRGHGRVASAQDQAGPMSFGGKRVAAIRRTGMMLPGYCKKCRKMKRVQVTQLLPQGIQIGVCNQCQDKEDEQRTKKLAYGETVAPPRVNTLREANCPICGTEEGYNGDTCLVCGYVKPPDIYMDPDLNKAQEVDLRQDQGAGAVPLGEMTPGVGGELVCDNCGETVPDAAAPEMAHADGPVEPAGATPSGAPAAGPTPAPGEVQTGQPTPGQPLAENPAQQPKPPTPPNGPQGSEMGDVPPKPPKDTSGAGGAPADADKKEPTVPPAGEKLPKEKGDDTSAKPGATPEDADKGHEVPPSGGPGDKAPEKGSAPSDHGGPDSDDSDSAPFPPKGDDGQGSDKDKPAAHEGDPCPICGQGTLSKKEAEELDAGIPGDPTKDNPLGASDSDKDPDHDGDDDRPGSTDDPDHLQDEEDAGHDPDGNEPQGDKEDNDHKKAPKPWETDDKSKQGVKRHQPEGVNSMAPRDLMKVAQEQQRVIRAQSARLAKQDEQLRWLYKAVNKLAFVAGLRTTADEANPGNPIPEPGNDAPFTTLNQERQPNARGNVTDIGGVGGSTDVGANSTTTVDQVGGIAADSPYNVSEDVTKGVDGATEMRPLDEVRTVPEIQFGNPLKPDAAFPLQGEWAGKSTVGSQDRTFAAMRLARLRISAGVSNDDEFILAQAIASNFNVPDAAIAQEIDTLSRVVAAQGRQAQPRTASQVRRTMAPGSTRTVPSMTSTNSGFTATAGGRSVIDDSHILFE